MKTLVLLFLCSCVFGVPLEKQEEALAELLQKVLESDPGDNIIVEESTNKDIATIVNNVANATELPEIVDTTLINETNQKKPVTIIGEIILDPTPEEDTTEPVSEIAEQSDTESFSDTKPLTGTLIVETISDDDKMKSEGPTKTDYPQKSPVDEPMRDPSDYDTLDTPVRIPLNHGSVHRDWIGPFPNRFKVFRPLNKDYDDHFTMLENPFLSPLDTLPMDQPFFESTTHANYDVPSHADYDVPSHADYDVPSHDYPMYDDVYDDNQTPKNINNESNPMKNSLEPLTAENDVIQVAEVDKVPNDQSNVEDPTMMPLDGAPDADMPPASNADAVSNSEPESAMPFNQHGIPDDMKVDYDYADGNIHDYPLENNPDYENYFSHNVGYNMEREPDFIRYNTRGPFLPHYYDSYDKYINIGDTKHFNPYIFYPKRHDGYDLFFRPSYDMENRGKMMPQPPSNVMEPPRKAEIKYDDNLNFDKNLPQDNIETNMDEANTNIDNTNNYADNLNAESTDQPQDNSFVEQDTPQDVYNEDYGNKLEWNPHHPVLDSDFHPMADLPVQRHGPVIEIPRYFDNGFPYYGGKYVNKNKDMSMYLFNRLARNLGDNSRFRRFDEYRNNPYKRNDGPIIIFVGPPPRNQDSDTTQNTNDVTSESENQFINSEGTLLTDIKHNVDIPYSPGYHPSFYSNYHLYGNNDKNIEDNNPYTGPQSFTPVDMSYNGIIGSYPYQHDDFGYNKKYFKRASYRNRDYRYSNDIDNLYKPDRYYYRREPRSFMDDNLYY